MKVGDLVAATLHTEETLLGIISECKPTKDMLSDDFADATTSALDLMFPYFVCFNDDSFDDWYGSQTLEVVSESR